MNNSEFDINSSIQWAFLKTTVKHVGLRNWCMNLKTMYLSVWPVNIHCFVNVFPKHSLTNLSQSRLTFHFHWMNISALKLQSFSHLTILQYIQIRTASCLTTLKQIWFKFMNWVGIKRHSQVTSEWSTALAC